jgi:hypothetical protein
MCPEACLVFQRVCVHDRDCDHVRDSDFDQASVALKQNMCIAPACAVSRNLSVNKADTR